jgi:hypothetical protein
MKSLSKLLLAFGLLIGGLNAVKAQSSLKDDKADKATEVKSLVNSKDFVFEATKKGAMPLSYHKYDVAVSKDTLIAYLPGHAAPLKFNCTNFAYNVMDGKGGSMDVVIKPDAKMADVKQIKMDISPQGHAMLRVVRTNGGPLTFDGYIKQEDY